MALRLQRVAVRGAAVAALQRLTNKPGPVVATLAGLSTVSVYLTLLHAQSFSFVFTRAMGLAGAYEYEKI